mmetsp:Transcript_24273/g.74123  ORF Transcript_24273/g.74123 Transcript_24273/m.74123 type:complete len:345 (+) Transcript_24273:546-1580(+)
MTPAALPRQQGATAARTHAASSPSAAPTPHGAIFARRFHWMPNIFERSAYGDNFAQAFEAGKNCRNETFVDISCPDCGKCDGPFPFASGFLIIVGQDLALEITRSSILADDVRRLSTARSIRSKSGRPASFVMEDIWLGSVVHRMNRARQLPWPVLYLTMRSHAYGRRVNVHFVDGWGLKVTPVAMLIHLRNKLIERFLAVHDFMTKPSVWCGAVEFALECRSGCAGFASHALEYSVDELAKMHQEAREKRDKLAEWERDMVDALVTAPFCTGPVQAEARFCEMKIEPPRDCCIVGKKRPEKQEQAAIAAGKPRHCSSPVDILANAYSPKMQLRAEELMNSSHW